MEYDDVIVPGVATGPGEPVWEPLEAFLPYELLGGFMYMHRLRLDHGQVVHAYKHSESRRYLLLDEAADAWEDLDRNRFRRMRHSDAIEHAFPTPWVLHHATDKDQISLKQALEAAWARGNGDEAAGAHILPSSPACAMRQLP